MFSSFRYLAKVGITPTQGLAAVIALGAFATAGVAGDSPGRQPDCIVVAQAQAPLEAAGTAERAQRSAPTAADTDRLRPISEQEAQLLMQALEPVALPDRRGRTIRAMREGTELDLERMDLLVGDVTAIVAALHAEETLGQLDASGMRADRRAWGRAALEAIQQCAEARFRERGARAFESSKRVVEQHREALEEVLLGGGQ